MPFKSSSTIELMSPAGDFAALQAALDGGCDSIYFGVGQLNMRSVSSANFALEDMAEVVARARAKGVKTYLALNTVMYDHDMSFMRSIVDQAAHEGVDALIVADHAAILYAREKNVPVHISTQISIMNYETVAFYAQYADAVVLARELGLGQIARIARRIEKENLRGVSGDKMKIEVFGHGALCMAISGKCHLSLHTHNASANRGACRQNCRKKYYVTDEDGNELLIDNEYIMSPKDLCVLPFLDQLIDAGVSILKIEGRGRAADYVATTTHVYRDAIDAYYAGTFNQAFVVKSMEALDKVYNRGFWSGYYLGQELGAWTEDHPGSHATRKKIYVGRGVRYYPNLKVAQFKIESYDIKKHDTMLLIGPELGVREFVLDTFKLGDRPTDKARKGDEITIPLDCAVGRSTKLYKLVNV